MLTPPRPRPVLAAVLLSFTLAGPALADRYYRLAEKLVRIYPLVDTRI